MARKTISALKAEAKAKGIPTSLIRANIDSAAKLETLISNYGNSTREGTMATKATPRKATKAKPRRATRARTATKATKVAEAPKRRGRPPGSKNKPKVTEAPKRRGRPPGSKNRVQAPKPRAGAKKPTPKISNNGDAGRFTLENIDWYLGEEDGWNPRPGSPPDQIIRAVRKVANRRTGSVDREKVFLALRSQAKSFLTNRASDRSKAAAEKMLRYRISRIMWQYAIQTEQHEISENRAEYGTAGTGSGTFKRGRARKAPAKATQTAPKRRGRPPKAKSTPTRRKATQGRTATKPKRGPGRPRGSKNRTRR